MPAKKYEFNAVIEEGRGGGAWVRVPLVVQKEFGTKGHVRVRATFDGEVYRGSLAPMSGGAHIIGIRKSIRESIGKDIGDRVEVVLQRDAEERVVEVPPELMRALALRPAAKRRYAQLSYTHRKEFAQWVAEAKKPETRKRRAAQAVDRILQR